MRSRNIKPDFFRDAELNEVSIETRYLFIGLWCMADREGKLKDTPKQIRFEIFPETKTQDDIETLLQALVDHGQIVRYEVCNRKYIKVVNFLKHQSPHHTEKKSQYPDPPGIHGESPLDNGNPRIQKGNISIDGFDPDIDSQPAIDDGDYGKEDGNRGRVSTRKYSKKENVTVTHRDSPLSSVDIPLIPDSIKINPPTPQRGNGSVVKTFKYPEWVNQPLWFDFVKMRTRIKKPIMTERTVSNLIAKLEGLIAGGYKQEDIIQKAIDSCWQSFYPPREGMIRREGVDSSCPSPPLFDPNNRYADD